jgi:chemotaxis protein CheD
VGDSNAHWALQALAADGVRVLHHDLGGPSYRKLAWTVGPGAPEVTAVPL